MGMNITLKDEVHQLSQQCKSLRENLNLVKKEFEKKDKEDNKLKENERKVQSEKSELIPKIGEEEENLKLKLNQVKTKLGSFCKDSVAVRRDLKDKENQLEMAQKEHSDVQQELEKVKRDAKETLDYIMAGMERDKKNHNKDRKMAFKRFKKYAEELSKTMREESVKMQSKLEKMKIPE